MLDGQAPEDLADPACQAGCPSQFRTGLAHRHAACELSVGDRVAPCGFGVGFEGGGDVSGFHSGIGRELRGTCQTIVAAVRLRTVYHPHGAVLPTGPSHHTTATQSPGPSVRIDPVSNNGIRAKARGPSCTGIVS